MVQIDILTYNILIISIFFMFTSCYLIVVLSNFSIIYLHNSAKTNLSSITCIDFKNAAGLIKMNLD